jgi:hypothetical protein
LTGERIGQPLSREKSFYPEADVLDNAESNNRASPLSAKANVYNYCTELKILALTAVRLTEQQAPESPWLSVVSEKKWAVST